MIIHCHQDALAVGLSVVSKAVASRNTSLPVLANILLSTDNGRLKLSATNLEIGINCWIGAKVELEGAITVPARTFADLVNTLPPDRIDMELSVRTQTLHLCCGRSEANIKGIHAQDFPVFSSEQDGEIITIESNILKQAISQVVYAAGADESRLTLTGVIAKFDGDLLTMASADGYRVSISETVLESSVSKPFQVLIPAKTLTALSRIPSKQDEIEISFTPTRNQALFHLDNIDLVAQLIDLQFPDYEQIIPSQSDTKVVISTVDLRNAVNAANVFASEAANLLKLSIVKDSMHIAARSDETGDNASEIAATVTGPDVTIAFNAKYVLDWLKSVKSSQVRIELTNGNNPGVFFEVGNADYTHVIMPMQIGQ